MINLKDKNEMLIWAVKHNAVEVLRHFLALGVDKLVIEQSLKLTSNSVVEKMLSKKLKELEGVVE